jgi:general secretion pathway protein H
MSIASAPRHLRARSSERAVTLIEVLIVMAIVVVMIGGAAFTSDQIKRSRLKTSAIKVASAMRTGYQRASSTGKRVRLVVDMEQAAVWLEESTDVMALDTTDKLGTGGANPATAVEQASLAEANRISAGVQTPRAAFAPIDGPAGRIHPLESGIVVRAVDAMHDATPKTAGRGYVYFFASEAERASVQLKIANSDAPKDTFSIVLSPLSGKATVLEGVIPVLHPRDDAEASEVEDDGR